MTIKLPFVAKGTRIPLLGRDGSRGTIVAPSDAYVLHHAPAALSMKESLSLEEWPVDAVAIDAGGATHALSVARGFVEGLPEATFERVEEG